MGFNAVLRMRNIANTTPDQFADAMPEDLLKFGMLPEFASTDCR